MSPMYFVAFALGQLVTLVIQYAVFRAHEPMESQRMRSYLEED